MELVYAIHTFAPGAQQQFPKTDDLGARLTWRTGCTGGARHLPAEGPRGVQQCRAASTNEGRTRGSRGGHAGLHMRGVGVLPLLRVRLRFLRIARWRYTRGRDMECHGLSCNTCSTYVINKFVE